MKLGNKDIAIICVIALFAFAIRYALLSTEKVISTDAVQYLTLGKNLLAGKGYVSDGSHYPDVIRPPVYPFLIGLFHFVVKDFERAGRMVSVILGSFLAVIVYALSVKLFDRITGIIGSIFIMIHPVLTDISISVGSDASFVFFLTIGIIFGWMAVDRGGLRYFLLAGIFFGLSYLVRVVGLMYLFGYLLVAVYLMKVGGNSVKSGVKGLAVLLVGFAILFGPYMLLVEKYTGIWMEPGYRFATAQAEWEGKVNERLKENSLPGMGLSNEVRKFEAIHHGLDDSGKEIMLWEKMKKLEDGRERGGG